MDIDDGVMEDAGYDLGNFLLGLLFLKNISERRDECVLEPFWRRVAPAALVNGFLLASVMTVVLQRLKKQPVGEYVFFREKLMAVFHNIERVARKSARVLHPLIAPFQFTFRNLREWIYNSWTKHLCALIMMIWRGESVAIGVFRQHRKLNYDGTPFHAAAVCTTTSHASTSLHQISPACILPRTHQDAWLKQREHHQTNAFSGEIRGQKCIALSSQSKGFTDNSKEKFYSLVSPTIGTRTFPTAHLKSENVISASINSDMEGVGNSDIPSRCSACCVDDLGSLRVFMDWGDWAQTPKRSTNIIHSVRGHTHAPSRAPIMPICCDLDNTIIPTDSSSELFLGQECSNRTVCSERGRTCLLDDPLASRACIDLKMGLDHSLPCSSSVLTDFEPPMKKRPNCAKQRAELDAEMDTKKSVRKSPCSRKYPRKRKRNLGSKSPVSTKTTLRMSSNTTPVHGVHVRGCQRFQRIMDAATATYPAEKSLNYFSEVDNSDFLLSGPEKDKVMNPGAGEALRPLHEKDIKSNKTYSKSNDQAINRAIRMGFNGQPNPDGRGVSYRLAPETALLLEEDKENKNDPFTLVNKRTRNVSKMEVEREYTFKEGKFIRPPPGTKVMDTTYPISSSTISAASSFRSEGNSSLTRDGPGREKLTSLKLETMVCENSISQTECVIPGTEDVEKASLNMTTLTKKKRVYVNRIKQINYCMRSIDSKKLPRSKKIAPFDSVFLTTQDVFTENIRMVESLEEYLEESTTQRTEVLSISAISPLVRKRTSPQRCERDSRSKHTNKGRPCAPSKRQDLRGEESVQGHTVKTTLETSQRQDRQLERVPESIVASLMSLKEPQSPHVSIKATQTQKRSGIPQRIKQIRRGKAIIEKETRFCAKQTCSPRADTVPVEGDACVSTASQPNLEQPLKQRSRNVHELPFISNTSIEQLQEKNDLGVLSDTSQCLQRQKALTDPRPESVITVFKDGTSCMSLTRSSDASFKGRERGIEHQISLLQADQTTIASQQTPCKLGGKRSVQPELTEEEKEQMPSIGTKHNRGPGERVVYTRNTSPGRPLTRSVQSNFSHPESHITCPNRAKDNLAKSSTLDTEPAGYRCHVSSSEMHWISMAHAARANSIQGPSPRRKDSEKKRQGSQRSKTSSAIISCNTSPHKGRESESNYMLSSSPHRIVTNFENFETISNKGPGSVSSCRTILGNMSALRVRKFLGVAGGVSCSGDDARGVTPRKRCSSKSEGFRFKDRPFDACETTRRVNGKVGGVGSHQLRGNKAIQIPRNTSEVKLLRKEELGLRGAVDQHRETPSSVHSTGGDMQGEQYSSDVLNVRCEELGNRKIEKIPPDAMTLKYQSQEQQIDHGQEKLKEILRSENAPRGRKGDVKWLDYEETPSKGREPRPTLVTGLDKQECDKVKHGSHKQGRSQERERTTFESRVWCRNRTGELGLGGAVHQHRETSSPSRQRGDAMQGRQSSISKLKISSQGLRNSKTEKGVYNTMTIKDKGQALRSSSIDTEKERETLRGGKRRETLRHEHAPKGRRGDVLRLDEKEATSKERERKSTRNTGLDIHGCEKVEHGSHRQRGIEGRDGTNVERRRSRASAEENTGVGESRSDNMADHNRVVKRTRNCKAGRLHFEMLVRRANHSKLENKCPLGGEHQSKDWLSKTESWKSNYEVVNNLKDDRQSSKTEISGKNFAKRNDIRKAPLTEDTSGPNMAENDTVGSVYNIVGQERSSVDDIALKDEHDANTTKCVEYRDELGAPTPDGAECGDENGTLTASGVIYDFSDGPSLQEMGGHGDQTVDCTYATLQGSRDGDKPSCNEQVMLEERIRHFIDNNRGCRTRIDKYGEHILPQSTASPGSRTRTNVCVYNDNIELQESGEAMIREEDSAPRLSEVWPVRQTSRRYKVGEEIQTGFNSEKKSRERGFHNAFNLLSFLMEFNDKKDTPEINSKNSEEDTRPMTATSSLRLYPSSLAISQPEHNSITDAGVMKTPSTSLVRNRVKGMKSTKIQRRRGDTTVDNNSEKSEYTHGISPLALSSDETSYVEASNEGSIEVLAAHVKDESENPVLACTLDAQRSPMTPQATDSTISLSVETKHKSTICTCDEDGFPGKVAEALPEETNRRNREDLNIAFSNTVSMFLKGSPIQSKNRLNRKLVKGEWTGKHPLFLTRPWTLTVEDGKNQTLTILHDPQRLKVNVSSDNRRKDTISSQRCPKQSFAHTSETPFQLHLNNIQDTQASSTDGPLSSNATVTRLYGEKLLPLPKDITTRAINASSLSTMHGFGSAKAINEKDENGRDMGCKMSQRQKPVRICTTTNSPKGKEGQQLVTHRNLTHSVISCIKRDKRNSTSCISSRHNVSTENTDTFVNSAVLKQQVSSEGEQLSVSCEVQLSKTPTLSFEKDIQSISSESTEHGAQLANRSSFSKNTTEAAVGTRHPILVEQNVYSKKSRNPPQKTTASQWRDTLAYRKRLQCILQKSKRTLDIRNGDSSKRESNETAYRKYTAPVHIKNTRACEKRQKQTAASDVFTLDPVKIHQAERLKVLERVYGRKPFTHVGMDNKEKERRKPKTSAPMLSRKGRTDEVKVRGFTVTSNPKRAHINCRPETPHDETLTARTSIAAPMYSNRMMSNLSKSQNNVLPKNKSNPKSIEKIKPQPITNAAEKLGRGRTVGRKSSDHRRLTANCHRETSSARGTRNQGNIRGGLSHKSVMPSSSGAGQSSNPSNPSKNSVLPGLVVGTTGQCDHQVITDECGNPRGGLHQDSDVIRIPKSQENTGSGIGCLDETLQNSLKKLLNNIVRKQEDRRVELCGKTVRVDVSTNADTPTKSQPPTSAPVWKVKPQRMPTVKQGEKKCSNICEELSLNEECTSYPPKEFEVLSSKSNEDTASAVQASSFTNMSRLPSSLSDIEEYLIKKSTHQQKLARESNAASKSGLESRSISNSVLSYKSKEVTCTNDNEGYTAYREIDSHASERTPGDLLVLSPKGMIVPQTNTLNEHQINAPSTTNMEACALCGNTLEESLDNVNNARIPEANHSFQVLDIDGQPSLPENISTQSESSFTMKLQSDDAKLTAMTSQEKQDYCVDETTLLCTFEAKENHRNSIAQNDFLYQSSINDTTTTNWTHPDDVVTIVGNGRERVSSIRFKINYGLGYLRDSNYYRLRSILHQSQFLPKADHLSVLHKDSYQTISNTSIPPHLRAIQMVARNQDGEHAKCSALSKDRHSNTRHINEKIGDLNLGAGLKRGNEARSKISDWKDDTITSPLEPCDFSSPNIVENRQQDPSMESSPPVRQVLQAPCIKTSSEKTKQAHNTRRGPLSVSFTVGCSGVQVTNTEDNALGSRAGETVDHAGDIPELCWGSSTSEKEPARALVEPTVVLHADCRQDSSVQGAAMSDRTRASLVSAPDPEKERLNVEKSLNAEKPGPFSVPSTVSLHADVAMSDRLVRDVNNGTTKDEIELVTANSITTLAHLSKDGLQSEDSIVANEEAENMTYIEDNPMISDNSELKVVDLPNQILSENILQANGSVFIETSQSARSIGGEDTESAGHLGEVRKGTSESLPHAEIVNDSIRRQVEAPNFQAVEFICKERVGLPVLTARARSNENHRASHKSKSLTVISDQHDTTIQEAFSEITCREKPDVKFQKVSYFFEGKGIANTHAGSSESRLREEKIETEIKRKEEEASIVSKPHADQLSCKSKLGFSDVPRMVNVLKELKSKLRFRQTGNNLLSNEARTQSTGNGETKVCYKHIISETFMSYTSGYDLESTVPQISKNEIVQADSDDKADLGSIRKSQSTLTVVSDCKTTNLRHKTADEQRGTEFMKTKYGSRTPTSQRENFPEKKREISGISYDLQKRSKNMSSVCNTKAMSECEKEMQEDLENLLNSEINNARGLGAHSKTGLLSAQKRIRKKRPKQLTNVQQISPKLSQAEVHTIHSREYNGHPKSVSSNSLKHSLMGLNREGRRAKIHNARSTNKKQDRGIVSHRRCTKLESFLQRQTSKESNHTSESHLTASYKSSLQKLSPTSDEENKLTHILNGLTEQISNGPRRRKRGLPDIIATDRRSSAASTLTNITPLSASSRESCQSINDFRTNSEERIESDTDRSSITPLYRTKKAMSREMSHGKHHNKECEKNVSEGSRATLQNYSEACRPRYIEDMVNREDSSQQCIASDKRSEFRLPALTNFSNLADGVESNSKRASSDHTMTTSLAIKNKSIKFTRQDGVALSGNVGTREGAAIRRRERTAISDENKMLPQQEILRGSGYTSPASPARVGQDSTTCLQEHETSCVNQSYFPRSTQHLTQDCLPLSAIAGNLPHMDQVTFSLYPNHDVSQEIAPTSIISPPKSNIRDRTPEFATETRACGGSISSSSSSDIVLSWVGSDTFDNDFFMDIISSSNKKSPGETIMFENEESRYNVNSPLQDTNDSNISRSKGRDLSPRPKKEASYPFSKVWTDISDPSRHFMSSPQKTQYKPLAVSPSSESQSYQAGAAALDLSTLSASSKSSNIGNAMASFTDQRNTSQNAEFMTSASNVLPRGMDTFALLHNVGSLNQLAIKRESLCSPETEIHINCTVDDINDFNHDKNVNDCGRELLIKPTSSQKWDQILFPTSDSPNEEQTSHRGSYVESALCYEKTKCFTQNEPQMTQEDICQNMPAFHAFEPHQFDIPSGNESSKTDEKIGWLESFCDVDQYRSGSSSRLKRRESLSLEKHLRFLDNENTTPRLREYIEDKDSNNWSKQDTEKKQPQENRCTMSVFGTQGARPDVLEEENDEQMLRTHVSLEQHLQTIPDGEHQDIENSNSKSTSSHASFNWYKPQSVPSSSPVHEASCPHTPQSSTRPTLPSLTRAKARRSSPLKEATTWQQSNRAVEANLSLGKPNLGQQTSSRQVLSPSLDIAQLDHRSGPALPLRSLQAHTPLHPHHKRSFPVATDDMGRKATDSEQSFPVPHDRSVDVSHTRHLQREIANPRQENLSLFHEKALIAEQTPHGMTISSKGTDYSSDLQLPLPRKGRTHPSYLPSPKQKFKRVSDIVEMFEKKCSNH